MDFISNSKTLYQNLGESETIHAKIVAHALSDFDIIYGTQNMKQIAR